MELKHIEIDYLKPANVNVRKKGGKDIADLVPSIKSLGIVQPLLVRPNCEGYEIVAGQRRYHALVKLAEEESIDPVPCLVMDEGDDAKAIEASLAENIARLPMDEIDQYKAFAALAKTGSGIADIAEQFGITERLVKQRLAIANLIGPILTAYRKQEIGAATVRSLTLATKRQQKAWWELFKGDDCAPQGSALKDWLFGGADISTDVALFDEADYSGNIITDMFSENRYFDDAAKFWECQNTAIAEAKAKYLENGWSEVVILDVGAFFYSYDYCQTTKKNGGKVFVQIAYGGEVTFHEGYLTKKEAQRLEKAKAKASGEVLEEKPERPELTKPMQNYLDLHRHSAVRMELLAHANIALRLAVAQIIAGSKLWSVQAEPQKAASEAIGDSLKTNKAENIFAAERNRVRALLGMGETADETLVYRKGDWGKSHDVHEIFAKLMALDDASITMILTFIIAETLPCGDALVESLGNLLNVDMADHWQPDDTFLDLMRDKEAINAMVKEVAGKITADAHISSTATVQKKIIRDCHKGTRKGKTDWQPRYMDFPMRAYTKRGGIDAIGHWKAVKKHFRQAA